MTVVEIEVDGKLCKYLRSATVPAVGEVMSIDNAYALNVVKRHWVIDSNCPSGEELRCILECAKQ